MTVRMTLEITLLLLFMAVVMIVLQGIGPGDDRNDEPGAPHETAPAATMPATPGPTEEADQ